MKRNKMTVLCIVLALVLLATSIFMVSCKDPEVPEKKDAIITAESVQSFIYDGQLHNVTATLNHDETQLVYSPAQGYTDKGEYEITVSAAETENYKAVSRKVLLKIADAPAKTTYELWEDFTSGLKQSFALEGKDKLKVNIQASASVKNSGVTTKYALDVMGNLDLSQTQNNSTLFHAVISADGKNIGVYYQDNAMYLQIVDQLFKIKNSDLTALLTSVNAEQSTAVDLSGLLNLLPMLLFRDEQDIVCNDGVYEITIDVTHIWEFVNSDFVQNLIKNMISKENMEILNGFFTKNEMQFKFAVDLSDDSNAFANVTVKDGVASLGAFEIAGGSYDYVTGKLDQEDIEGIDEINLADIRVKGGIDLIDRTGKDYEHLTYELVANVDPFALVNAIKNSPSTWMNDEEVKKMKIYFSLYHEHTPGDGGIICTDAMCPTRVGGQDDTTLLDIAFDPTNFGNSQLYVAANLSRIFSDASFDKTLTSITGLAFLIKDKVADLKTQNFLTSIDLGLLMGGSEDSDPDDPSDPDEGFKFDVNTMLDPIISVITKCITLDSNGITLDMQQTYALLNQAFNLDQYIDINLEGFIVIDTSVIVNTLFKGILSPDGAADTDQEFNYLRIAVDEIEFGVTEEFNCKEAITHLPTDIAVERTFGGHNPLSFEGANPKATGRVFSTKVALGDNYTSAGGIHLTIDELDRIIGKNIEYTYTAIDGQTYTANSQLVALKGLDETKLGQKQTVTAVVLPLDGQGGLFSDGLWKVLTGLYGSIAGSFLPEHIALPLGAATMDIDIYLTEIDYDDYAVIVDNEIPSNFELTPYSIDPNAKTDMSQYMTAQFTIKYKDGYSRNISITANDTDLVDGKYLVNDGQEHYIAFTVEGYDGDVKKISGIKANDPEKPSLVMKDNGGIMVATYDTSTSNLKLNAVLKTSSSSSAKVIDTSEYRLFIGGKTLDEINLAGEGASVFNLAESGENVKVEFKKTAAAQSGAYLYFSLTYEDGSSSAEVRYTATTFKKLAQGTVWSLTSLNNLGSNLDGKLVYNYWLDSDDDYAPVRTLSLKFEDGKYYMVDDEGTKIEVNLTVKDLELVNGLIKEEDYKMLHYDSAKKTTQSPKITLNAFSFELNGETVNVASKIIYVAVKYNFDYVKFSSNIAPNTLLDDMFKFVVMDAHGREHDMRLTYKGNGKYVFRDTFDGNKLSDIDVEVKAYIGANTSGEVFDLVDGKISNDKLNQKVTLEFVFSYDGMNFEASNKSSNKTVK